MRAFKIVGGVDVVGMALLQTSPPSVRMGSARGRGQGQGHVGLQGARSSRCRKASGNAASALGLHRLRVLHLVVFPQAIHIATLPTVGFLVQLIKATSLAAIIGFTELTRAGQILVNSTFESFRIYMIVAIIYFILCFPLTLMSRQLERHFSRRL